MKQTINKQIKPTLLRRNILLWLSWCALKLFQCFSAYYTCYLKLSVRWRRKVSWYIGLTVRVREGPDVVEGQTMQCGAPMKMDGNWAKPGFTSLCPTFLLKHRVPSYWTSSCSAAFPSMTFTPTLTPIRHIYIYIHFSRLPHTCPEDGNCNVPWNNVTGSTRDKVKLQKLQLYIRHRPQAIK
jgi:hypothetical protein